MTGMKLDDKIYIYRLKIDYITMQCAILFKTTAEYKSQQRGKLYRPPIISGRLISTHLHTLRASFFWLGQGWKTQWSSL